MTTTPEAYVHLSTDKTTLTFYYDTLRADRNGKTWGIRDWDAFFSCPAWAGDFNSRSTTVLTAVFDASFRDFRPTTTARWFTDLRSLKSIEGFEHLNTTEVTDMSWMFAGCESLTAIDLSSFDTSKVTDMRGMFYSCESLTTIYCNSSWSDRLSDDMFSGCNSLRGAATNVGNSYDVSMANPETGYFTKKVLS